MNYFDEYFNHELIVELLSRIRASNAQKLHNICFFNSLYKNRNSVSIHRPKIFPPRREWVRQSENKRSGICSFDINRRSIQLTYMKHIENTGKSDRIWFHNYLDFVEDIKESVIQSLDYRISIPSIRPIPKDKKEKTYRPIAVYNLKDRIIIGLTARYIRDSIDKDFIPNSYAFRSKVDNNMPTHHSAVQDLLRYSTRFRKKYLHVAEADICKFYDTVHHHTAINGLNLAIERLNKRGEYLDSRAISIFKSYLDSYSFLNTAYSLGIKRIEEIYGDIGGEIPWVGDKLSNWYENINDEPIGIPQGGALSVIIANLVLDYADREVINNPGDYDEKLFYARYCDDVIIIHSNRRKCNKALNRYMHALYNLKLIEHKPEIINNYSIDYFKSKSKAPFKWGKPCGDRSVVPWISFVGYQIRRDGTIRIRMKSIKKEIKKQIEIAREVKRIIRTHKKDLRRSKRSIELGLAKKLISMSVGKVNLWDYKSTRAHFCWCSGFKLLYNNKAIIANIKRLDTCRRNQIRRIHNHLRDAVDVKKKSYRRVRKPKKYGAPFSYYYHYKRFQKDL